MSGARELEVIQNANTISEVFGLSQQSIENTRADRDMAIMVDTIPLEDSPLVEDLVGIRRLLDGYIKLQPGGTQVSLGQREKEAGRYIFRGICDIDFESTEDGMIIYAHTTSENLVVILADDGVVHSNLATLQDLERTLGTIFTQHEDGRTDLNSDLIAGAHRSLSYFRSRDGKGPVNVIHQDDSLGPVGEGAELIEYGDRATVGVRAEALASELMLTISESNEALPFDRDEVFYHAVDTALNDYQDRASESTLENMRELRNGRVLFLDSETYQTILDSRDSNFAENTTGMVTLDGGIVIVNQEHMSNLSGRASSLERYRAVHRESMPDLSTPDAAINALADYIEIAFGIGNTPIENVEVETDDDELANELMEHIMWGLAYHESLHVLSSNNHLLVGLDETTTHALTALAVLRERGPDAFGAYLVFSGFQYAFNFEILQRDFDLTREHLLDIYFNQDGSWDMERIFESFPTTDEETFDILLTGEVDNTSAKS